MSGAGPKGGEVLKIIAGELVKTAFFLLILGVILHSVATECFEFFIKDKEEIKWDSDYMAAIVVECRYPFGSIFNKDEMVLSNKIIIRERSILGDEKSTVPFSQIKKVVFSEGFIWKSVMIIKKDLWEGNVTLYFKDEDTKKMIMQFIVKSDPKIVVVEKNTLSLKLYKFYKYLEK